MEHLVLYKMKGNMSDEQEKDMLDHLYSLQYYYRGILAVSLGASSHPRSLGVNPQMNPAIHSLLNRFSDYLASVFRKRC